MHKKNEIGVAASLLAEFRKSGNNSQTFTKLVNFFQPDLKQIAARYPHFWKDDFIQEGTLGLFNAAKKYSNNADSLKFYFYAYKAIRSRMHNYWVSTMVRQPQIEGNLEQDSGLQLPVYETSITWDIDFKYYFSPETLTINGLSENEITAIDLHLIGYTGTEIAQEMNLSEGQVSKLIKNAKRKTQKVLSNQ